MRNNLRIKDRGSISINSRIKSASALDSFKKQVDDNLPSQKPIKSAKSLKAKRKSKISESVHLSSYRLKEDTENTTLQNYEQPTRIQQEKSSEEKLEEIINQEYLNCQTLVKRNEQERGRLNELMRKLDDELKDAQVDLANEDSNLMAFILKNKTTNFRRKSNSRMKKARIKRRHTFTSFNESFHVNQVDFKNKNNIKNCKLDDGPISIQHGLDSVEINQMVWSGDSFRAEISPLQPPDTSQTNQNVVKKIDTENEIKFRNLLKDHIDTQFESLI